MVPFARICLGESTAIHHHGKQRRPASGLKLWPGLCGPDVAGLRVLGPLGQERDMAVAGVAGLGLGKRRPPCLRRVPCCSSSPCFASVGATASRDSGPGWSWGGGGVGGYDDVADAVMAGAAKAAGRGRATLRNPPARSLSSTFLSEARKRQNEESPPQRPLSNVGLAPCCFCIAQL